MWTLSDEKVKLNFCFVCSVGTLKACSKHALFPRYPRWIAKEEKKKKEKSNPRKVEKDKILVPK